MFGSSLAGLTPISRRQNERAALHPFIVTRRASCAIDGSAGGDSCPGDRVFRVACSRSPFALRLELGPIHRVDASGSKSRTPQKEGRGELFNVTNQSKRAPGKTTNSCHNPALPAGGSGIRTLGPSCMENCPHPLADRHQSRDFSPTAPRFTAETDDALHPAQAERRPSIRA